MCTTALSMMFIEVTPYQRGLLGIVTMYTIGVNRPALGGTVPNLTAMSRCPALLTFYPAF